MNDRTDETRDGEHVWEAGWAGHERAQRLRMATWSIARKLRWLTEVNALARRIHGDEGYRRARRRALGLED